MEKELRVFAIIVTYNGRQWYDQCLSSLLGSSIPIDVVVVDNASKDGSVDYIRERFPQITVISSEKNLGFGQANNRGIRYALDCGCDYVLLLNQDAWVESNTIEELVSIHIHNKEYGILSPIHLTPEKSHIEKGLLTYLDDYRTTNRFLFEDLYFNRLKDIYQTSYVNAAVWLLPRAVLEHIGGFDPIFFHYEEDDNYLKRVFFHGYKVGVCPKISAVHDCDNKGVRVYSEEEKKRRYHSSLLERFTDVTKKESINRYLFYLLRKAVVSCCRGKVTIAKEHLSHIRYLCSQKKKIAFSWSTNRELGPHWL